MPPPASKIDLVLFRACLDGNPGIDSLAALILFSSKFSAPSSLRCGLRHAHDAGSQVPCVEPALESHPHRQTLVSDPASFARVDVGQVRCACDEPE